MKQPTYMSQGGQNWQWPEKTWFRERLNAMKAQENQQRRRPIVNSKQSNPIAAPESDPADSLKAE